MQITSRSIIRIVLLLFVLLTLSAIYPASSMGRSNLAHVSPMKHILNSSKPINSKEKLQTALFQSVSTLPASSHIASHTICNPCGTGDLVYQNGSAVELRPKAYAIFWGSNWKNSSGNLTMDGQVVQKYFSDVSGTPFENILTQYYMQNQNGSQSYIQNTLQFDKTHIWIDTSTPPNSHLCVGNTVEDSAIQTEVKKAITKKGWPQADPSATFFVYPPPNWAIRFPAPFPFWYAGCSNLVGSGFCGYHWMNPVTLTRYAPIVYPTKNCQVPQKPNGNIYGDSLANATSHEQFEAITDPRPYISGSQTFYDGWADNHNPPEEIGDKCAWNFLAGYTHLNNGGIFELQEEYSDATHSCVNAFTPHLTVNTTIDYSLPCTIAAYSLRCAINQVNSDGSGKPILFNIPASDSGCKLTTINGQNVYVCTITPTSGLPQLLASHITIDGYTQPGAQKNTLSIGSGDNAIITIRIDGAKTGGGLVLNNSASYDTIRGLEITGFNPYGILLNTSTNTNNTITGNFVGTDGVNALGNGVGIYIGGGSQNNTVGGQTPDTANIISGNSGQGILIGAGSGNTIEGNYIGTDTSGTATLRKGSRIVIPNPMSSSGIPNNAGIYVFANASGNMIGGITPASANIIGHNTYGVATDNSSNTNIIGNRINANVVGVFAENGETGDSISQNTIANNTTEGILVGNSSSDHVHVFMLDNSIFSNGGSGIDLYPGGTVNCSGPTAGAPNDYTACPVIQAATTTQVHGTACVGCRVEVYVATNDVDDQGHGEGPTFISSVNADSSGNWSVSVSLSAGTWVTATATTPSSPGPEETSEFAADVAVSNPVSGGNLWITGHDADYHCSQGDPGPGAACHYLLVAVNFVMRGSTLPILALDHGSQVATAITDAFGSSAPTVVTVDPRTGFATLPLVDTSGKPLYSAIIVASDTTCGGCDNNDGDGVTPDSDAINARTADIQTFFNAGGGILALAGADNYSVFYNFLPIQATGATTNPPYTLTSLGLSLGLVENQDDNCCQTHNSFQLPSSGSQFQVAETDAAGLAETMIVQNGTAVAWKRPVNSRLRPAHEPRNGSDNSSN